MGKRRILFVCTGNTCRSCMAEGLARKIAGEIEKLNEIEFSSAGTAAFDGLEASFEAVKVMAGSGIDLSNHRSKKLVPEMVASADLVLTMTVSHREKVREMVQEAADKVYTIAEYAGKGGDISDPIGCSLEVYRQCADEIKELVKLAIVRFLREKQMVE